MEIVLANKDKVRQKLAADVRHGENRAMKDEVFQWLYANMVIHNFVDRTAQKVTRQQPIVFRTAQAWVREWKKLQSARRL